MDGVDKNQIDMGFASIIDYLKLLVDKTDNTIGGNLAVQIKDSSTTILDSFKPAVNYLKLISVRFDKAYTLMSQHFRDVGKSLLKDVDKTKEKPKEKTSISGALSGSMMSVENQYNITFGSMKITDMKGFKGVLESLTNILKMDEDKLDFFNNFLEKLGKSLKSIETTAMNVGKSFLMIVGGFIAFSFLNFESFLKIALAIGVLGLTFEIISKRMSKVNTKKVTESFFDVGKSILSFAGGIVVLVGVSKLMEFIRWDSLLMMSAFIMALGLSLRYGGYEKPVSPLLNFSMSIGILTVALIAMNYVNMNSVFLLSGFIFLLGQSLKQGGFNKKNSSLLKFSFGIGMLTIAMYAMAELPWLAIGKMLTFVAGLGLIFKVFGFDKKLSPMLNFAFSIGVLTLAMYAMEELNPLTPLMMLGFIGGLGLVLKIFKFDNKLSPILTFSFAIGVLVLAMYAMEELNWYTPALLIGFIAGVGLALKLFDAKSGLSMAILAGGVFGLGLAFLLYKSANFQLIDALIFTGTVVAMVGVFALVGTFAPLIAIGSATGILMGLSAVLIGTSLAIISIMKFEPSKIIDFMLGTSVLALGFALLAVPMIPASIGALLFIPVGISALLGATSIMLISMMTFDSSKISEFMLSVGMIASGFALLAIPLIPASVGALLFIPVAISALLGALVLQKISNVEIETAKIQSFTSNVNTLIDGINEYGLITLGKTSVKALALLPVFGATYLGALALKKVSEVTIDKAKIIAFGEAMNLMTDTLIDSLSANEDKFASSKNGIEALSKLMGVSKGLAEVIQTMANLKFYEYEVRDGKLVMTGSRQLTDNDFKMVASNMGRMLQALIQPLELLGSNEDTITIGGFTMANPFKSNKTKQAIETIAGLGDAYKPIAESIKILAESSVMTDPELTKRFTDSLTSIMEVYLWTFEKLGAIDASLVKSSLTNIQTLNDSFNNLQTQSIDNVNQVFEKFVNNLSDDIKWKKMRSNLRFMRMEFEAIAKTVNSLNIEKATLFERNMRNLLDNNNGKKLQEAVEALQELLGMVQQGQVQQTQFISQTTERQNEFIVNNTPKPIQQTQQQNNANIESLVQQVIQVLGSVDSKLSNKLKVQIMNAGNGNMI